MDWIIIISSVVGTIAGFFFGAWKGKKEYLKMQSKQEEQKTNEQKPNEIK